MADPVAAAASTAAAEEDEVEVVEETEAEREARAKAKREAVPIALRVVTSRGEEVNFRVKSSTKLGKLMEAFCVRKGCRQSEIRFTFDGKRLAANQTVAQMEMEDGDVIDVHNEMVGGGNGTGEGKRKRDTKFDYDGVVDQDDYEDSEECTSRAAETMRNDIISALRLQEALRKASTDPGLLFVRPLANAWGSVRDPKEQLDLVLAVADGIRKRRLDYVAGVDNRAFNDH